MIVRMNKVTILCLDSARDQTLLALRDLGVLHVVPVQPADTDAVRVSAEQLERLKGTLNLLGPIDSAPETAPVAGDPEEIVRKIHELDVRRRELRDHIGILSAERDALLPLGDFEPARVAALAEKGISVRLCHVPPQQEPVGPAGTVTTVLSRDKAGTFVAMAGLGAFELPGREIPMPSSSLQALTRGLEKSRTELAGIEAEIARFSAARSALEHAVPRFQEKLDYQRNHDGMGTSRRIAYLQGFVPVESTDDLRKAAATHGWGLRIEEPAGADRVPVLVRIPRWARPIDVLFKFIKILPGYNEVDVSVSFLLFLSLFFAMIVGDAGYGAIITVAVILARLKFRKAPADPFILMGAFGLCTIVWGVLTGTYFGILNIPAPLQRLRVDWLTHDQNVISLCLLIGAIHLTVAHAWNVFRFINSLRAIAQVGWIGVTWLVFFLAKTLFFNDPLPGFFWPVAGASLVAIVLFMTPVQSLKAEWFNHVMLPLSFMSSFGDLLSYLRLFALGVAGVQLAQAFNTMCGSLTPTMGWVGPVLAGILLTAGHGLNIILSLVSVLVHGIRLNALEFSLHIGLEWAGFPYEPFRRRTLEKP